MLIHGTNSVCSVEDIETQALEVPTLRERRGLSTIVCTSDRSEDGAFGRFHMIHQNEGTLLEACMNSCMHAGFVFFREIIVFCTSKKYVCLIILSAINSRHSLL